MKIFVIASAVPFPCDGEPGVTATHIVTGALLGALRRRGHEIVLQCLFDKSRPPEPSSAENTQLQRLTGEGIRVFPPLVVPQRFTPPISRFRGLRLLCSLSLAEEHFYPGIHLSDILRERMEQAKAGVALSIWCPQGVAAMAHVDMPHVAYHGDIDDVPLRCRDIWDRPLFYGERGSLFENIERRCRARAHRRAHLRVMQKVSVIAGITHTNSVFYAGNGHPASFYTGNTWIDTPTPLRDALPEGRSGLVKIIGHAGYLNRTGGTYGLLFLLREVLPHLPAALGKRPFEVHIIGGAEPLPGIRPFLEHPAIVRHGFVPDLDAELRSADVFCLFNNAAPYVASYTRHQVSWSMGLCLIAHARSRLAIPEVAHGENALLASTGEEAAQMIAAAASDPSLSARIRRGGRETYERYSHPDAVALRLESLLQKAARRE